MSLWRVIILAVVQGLAKLLPGSSSAHVLVAEKLMGLDPFSPQMTLLLIMLHTGTMFAVIAFFWNTWQKAYFSSTDRFKQLALVAPVLRVRVGNLQADVRRVVIWATLLTWIVG